MTGILHMAVPSAHLSLFSHLYLAPTNLSVILDVSLLRFCVHFLHHAVPLL